MSESIDKEEFAESIRKAASKAAIDKALSNLVAMRKANCKSIGRGRNKNVYQNTIELLGALGTTISKDALQQRVSRALKEENNSQGGMPEQVSMLSLTTEVSSLTSDGQNSPSTEPSVSDNGPGAGRPKGTTKSQKKQENVNNLKCIEAIVLEYSSQASSAKSVGRKVDYGYLDKLIDAKKSEFNVKCEISKKNN